MKCVSHIFPAVQVGFMNGVRQGRRFVFTWNNPDGVPTRDTFGPYCTYLIYGHEVGDSGTFHLQGYVEFSRPTRPSVLFEAIPEAHWENARGTVKQCVDYCRKEHNWEEEGESSGGQGSRSDVNEVVALVRQRASIRAIAEAAPATFMRMHKGIYALMDVMSNPRTEYPEITVICGPTGTGKSRLARQMAPNAYWIFSHQWWDGYDPNSHVDVVWDEFYGISCPYVKLLRILDSTPCRLERKGSTLELNFRRIIITSNQHPADWYAGLAETHNMAWEASPLHRRIREFGRVIFTGEVHRVGARAPDNHVTCPECEQPYDPLNYHYCDALRAALRRPSQDP